MRTFISISQSNSTLLFFICTLRYWLIFTYSLIKTCKDIIHFKIVFFLPLIDIFIICGQVMILFSFHLSILNFVHNIHSYLSHPFLLNMQNIFMQPKFSSTSSCYYDYTVSHTVNNWKCSILVPVFNSAMDILKPFWMMNDSVNYYLGHAVLNK